jgi:hypothetical protein
MGLAMTDYELQNALRQQLVTIKANYDALPEHLKRQDIRWDKIGQGDIEELRKVGL